jgi:hypothetical protein
MQHINVNVRKDFTGQSVKPVPTQGNGTSDQTSVSAQHQRQSGMETNVSAIRICTEIIAFLVPPQESGIIPKTNAFAHHPKQYGLDQVANAQPECTEITVPHVQPQDFGMHLKTNVFAEVLWSGMEQIVHALLHISWVKEIAPNVQKGINGLMEDVKNAIALLLTFNSWEITIPPLLVWPPVHGIHKLELLQFLRELHLEPRLEPHLALQQPPAPQQQREIQQVEIQHPQQQASNTNAQQISSWPKTQMENMYASAHHHSPSTEN